MQEVWDCCTGNKLAYYYYNEIVHVVYTRQGDYDLGGSQSWQQTDEADEQTDGRVENIICVVVSLFCTALILFFPAIT